MNSDFHYYATFYAARMTGFEQKEAEKIAWAAEMVDELDEELAEENREKLKEAYIMTVQDPGTEMTDASDKFDTITQNANRGIWVPFHFLPGHFDGGYDEEVRHKEYLTTIDKIKEECKMSLFGFGSVPKKKEEYEACVRNKEESLGVSLNDITTDVVNTGPFDKFDHKYMDVCLKLRCGTNSEAVRFMLEYIRKKYDVVQDDVNKDYILYTIGIGMHVLADTWAHDGFSGAACYMVNTVYHTAADLQAANLESKLNARYAANYLKDWRIRDRGTIFDDVNSSIYLGHAQINHAPDYDFFSYQYYPRFTAPKTKEEREQDVKELKDESVKDKKLKKIDNPTRFRDAFLGMCNALRYITGRQASYNIPNSTQSFDNIMSGDTVRYDKIADEVKKEVFNTVPQKKNQDDHKKIVADKEEVWRKFLSNKAESVPDFKTYLGDLYTFAKAAKEYRNYIIDEYINKKLVSIYGANPPITFDIEKIDAQIKKWIK